MGPTRKRPAALPTGELETIPGVGPSIGKDLRELGFAQVEELADADSEELYELLCDLRGARIDRCVLYVFRCAIYFASHATHEPDLLKWWNWKERESAAPRDS